MPAAPQNSITMDQLGRFYKRVNSQIEKSIWRACRQTAKRGKIEAMHAIAKTKPYPPIDMQRLLYGYEVKVLPNGARLENITPYAAAHEFGNEAYTPPFSKLLEWAARKGQKALAVKIPKMPSSGPRGR